MNQPSFSIITSTLNCKELILRCLENVTQQMKNSGCVVEHLVIDSVSKDGTMDIIREYAKTHPHVRWISEPDKSMVEAANKGLRMAKNEILGWLGADDTFTPGAFGIVADYFRKYPALNFLMGSHNLVRNDGNLIRKEESCYTNRKDLVQFWKSSWRSIKLPWHATFYKRAVHEALGLYDEARPRNLEYEFYLRAATYGYEFMCIPEALTNFRYDEGGGTFEEARTKGWRRDMGIVSRKYWGSPLRLEYFEHFFQYSVYVWQRSIFKKRVKNLFYKLTHCNK